MNGQPYRYLIGTSRVYPSQFHVLECNPSMLETNEKIESIGALNACPIRASRETNGFYANSINQTFSTAPIVLTSSENRNDNISAKLEVSLFMKATYEPAYGVWLDFKYGQWDKKKRRILLKKSSGNGRRIADSY